MIDRQLNYGRHTMAGFLRQVAPFSTVLDLGAGSGDDLKLAREASPGATCFAVESYPPNVERLESQGVKVTAANVERERLPFEDASLDVVMTNQTLEHVKEIFWILHEASRVLKVDGHLVLGVPNLASLHNRLLLLAGKQPTCLQNHSAHVRGYTRHDLLRLFERVFPAGYSLEGFGGANFYPFPPAVARPLARMLPNHAWAIFLLLKKRREYAGEFVKYPVAERLETNFYLGEQDGSRHIV